MKHAQLKRELACAMAPDIARAFGLTQEDRVAEVIEGFFEEPHTEYVIFEMLDDLSVKMGITVAPWNDPDWYNEAKA